MSLKAKSTVNICDNTVDLKIPTSDSVSATPDENVIYVQTPNYPNEYLRNMDCNCSMRTTHDSSIKIELLEFDLESSSDDTNFADLKPNPNSLSKSLQKKQASNIENVQQCLRDYFQINAYSPFCGTLNQFSSIINVQKSDEEDHEVDANSHELESSSKHQITKFRFLSDDALTRRGFWIKIKGNSRGY